MAAMSDAMSTKLASGIDLALSAMGIAKRAAALRGGVATAGGGPRPRGDHGASSRAAGPGPAAGDPFAATLTVAIASLFADEASELLTDELLAGDAFVGRPKFAGSKFRGSKGSIDNTAGHAAATAGAIPRLLAGRPHLLLRFQRRAIAAVRTWPRVCLSLRLK